VSEIRGQPRQSPVEIDSLPIPAREAVHCKGVTQIVRSGADTTASWLEARGAVQVAERAAGRGHGERAPIRSDEHAVAAHRVEVDEGASCSQVTPELAGKGLVEWHPARSALGLGDEEDAPAEIDIADPKSERLSEPKPGAIEHEDECAVE